MSSEYCTNARSLPPDVTRSVAGGTSELPAGCADLPSSGGDAAIEFVYLTMCVSRLSW